MNKRRAKRRRHPLRILAVLAIVAALIAVCATLFGNSNRLLKRYPVAYEAEIRAAAEQFSLDPAYVASVVLAESSYDAQAVSSAGAMGLMQIMPSTGEWIAGKFDESFVQEDLFVPEVNLRYGCWYLRFLLDRYDGSMRAASAAYHQGQGRVDQWLEDPRYSSDGKTLEVIASAATNTYVNRIMDNYAHYQQVY